MGADVKSLIYVLSESKSGHGWFVKFGGVIIRGADGATIFHETIMEAKAYAQSHHTALIISALGIETGGEG